MADAQVDARLRILYIDLVHIVALLVGNHLQRQLIVIAKEDRPLACVRNVRCLIKDVGDRVAVLGLNGHEHSGHHRKMIIHLTFVTFAEV
jgi:hypothetical protein